MPGANPGRNAHYRRKLQIEILLPLTYNDGRPVEPSKRRQTLRDIVNQFGGCRITAGTKPAYEGHWEYGGRVYRDMIRSLIVEAPNRGIHYKWLSDFKHRLELRFKQVEIYISVTEIKRIV